MPSLPPPSIEPITSPQVEGTLSGHRRGRLFLRILVPFCIGWTLLLLLGAITLAWSGQAQEGKAWVAPVVLLVAALAGITLAAVFADRIAHAIFSPLRQLVRFAERTGHGETGLSIHLEHASELSMLARAFNRMSERLASQIAHIDQDSAQLRAILDGMVEGVVALDANERLLFVNERAIHLLDLPTDRPEGRRFWELVRVREMLDSVGQALSGSATVQRDIEWPGTPPRSLAVHAAPLRSEDDRQVLGAVVVIHDNTELRRLELLRRDFVANVSHELKTPLTVIKLCAENLDSGGAMDDPEARVRFVSQILQQTERLSFLIVDLLSLARIESGKESFNPQAIDTAEALEDCVARHREQALARQVNVSAQPVRANLWLWVDDEALTQVLDNLVNNAIKYTPAGGTVRLSARPGSQGLAELEITDSGTGIPDADLARIFERFFRVDKARSRELGGTGLGLSIVKHLVTANHGTVQARSKPGLGSTFTVSLPMVTGTEG